MIVRPVELQDRSNIRRLIEHRGTFNEEEVQVAMEVLDEVLRHPERSDYRAYCAMDGPESLSGYICFGRIPMTHECYDLYWIVVEETFSRKDVGGNLLEFMEEFLVRQKARRIYVDTSSSPAYEAARSFYKKHGYRVVCVLYDFYRQSDHKIIFMKQV